MKCFTTLVFSVFMFCFLQAQAPFTTLSKEPTHLQKKGKKYVFYDIKKAAEEFNSTQDLNTKKTLLQDKLEQDGAAASKDTTNVDFFSNSSLALTVLDKADSRASISAQVIFYKIGIFTPVDSTKFNYTYNIPVMLISKLSTSYDSISGSSALDVLDYEAAPVTLRIMPSFKLSSNKTYRETLMAGFYADARGINVQNTETNNYDLEMIGSGGIGFTFQGDGEAGFYNQAGSYEKGKWLVSAMLQGAIGDKEVIQKLFRTDKGHVTSFQAYFAFKIAENHKFNLKIGYQHLFQETIAGTKNNFSIAVGL